MRGKSATFSGLSRRPNLVGVCLPSVRVKLPGMGSDIARASSRPRGDHGIHCLRCVRAVRVGAMGGNGQIQVSVCLGLQQRSVCSGTMLERHGSDQVYGHDDHTLTMMFHLQPCLIQSCVCRSISKMGVVLNRPNSAGRR